MFFPCYNEEKNIEELVDKAKAAMAHITDDFEIILVNDGSRDRTAEVIDRLAQADPRIKGVHHVKNLGYGRAVRSGFKAATKDWVFFSDGDLQFDLTELKAFVPHTERSDGVIGYRKKRAEGFGRAGNAYLFKLFVNLVFRLGVRDINCAFKLIRNSRVRQLELISGGAMINTELLLKLKRTGLRFVELPVHHYPRRYGTPTGADIKVIFKAAVESLKLFISVRGR